MFIIADLNRIAAVTGFYFFVGLMSDSLPQVDSRSKRSARPNFDALKAGRSGVDTAGAWSIEDTADLYGLKGWGEEYFEINPDGFLAAKDPQGKFPSVALSEIADGLKQRGLDMPVMLRIENFLEHRIELLNTAFSNAIQECNYQNEFRGVFP